MYERGQGVDVNYKKAIEWWEKAAEQGHAQAQFFLGVLCEFGPQGVDQSDSMAIRWFAKAAAQGDEQAQARIDAIFGKRRDHRSSGAAASPAPREQEGQTPGR